MAAYSHSDLDITAVMTGADASIATQENEYSGSFAGWMVFNHNGGTSFWSGSTTTAWVKWNTGAGNEKSIDSYTMTSRGDGYAYTSPASWTLKGSNNDSDWDTLDTRSGISWDVADMKTFELASPSDAYRYFKFEFTSGSGAVAIGEIELLEAAIHDQGPVCYLPPNRRNRLNFRPLSAHDYLVSFPLPEDNIVVNAASASSVGGQWPVGTEGGWESTLLSFGKYDATGYANVITFPALNVPKGATILSAYPKYKAAQNGSGTVCNVNLHFTLADDPSPPSGASQAENLSLTDPVAWQVPAWTANQVYTGPDLKDILQVIVDRAGRVSGNNIQLVCRDNGSTGSAYRLSLAGIDVDLEVTYSMRGPACYIQAKRGKMSIGSVSTQNQLA